MATDPNRRLYSTEPQDPPRDNAGDGMQFGEAVATLPEVEVPSHLERGSVEEFLWKQRERRRIFCQEVETLRHDWSLRRTALVDELQREQKNCETQFEHLQKCVTGRGLQVGQLNELMEDVRAKLEKTKKETGQGAIPGVDAATIIKRSSALEKDEPAELPKSAQEPATETEPLITSDLALQPDPPDNAAAEDSGAGAFAAAEDGAAPAPTVIGKVDPSADPTPLFVSTGSKMSAGALRAEELKKKRGRNPCRRILFFENEAVCNKSWLPWIMHRPLVEGFCISVIAVHAIVMGANANYNAMNWKEKVDPWFVQNAEMMFYVWYVTEVVLRLLAFRGNFFTNSDWRWNCFDLACVVPWQDLVILLSGGKGSGGGMSFFRAIRMLKMVKMLRVIRLMKFFRELRLMMQMITGSLMTLMWTVVMLLMICYVFAIVFMYGMIAYLEDPSMYDPVHDSDLHKHWGSISKSIGSLYVAITGGLDWIVVADELKALGLVYYYFFFVFILFMFFGMMNIILGMFCEAANATAARDTSKVLTEESKLADGYMKAVTAKFKEIDVDNSHRISWDEFETLATTDEKVKSYLDWLDIEPKNARQLFRAFAGSGDSVDIEVFLGGLTKVKGDASRSQIVRMEQDMLVAFKQTGHFMHYFKDMTTKLYPKCLGHEDAPKSKRSNTRHATATLTLATTTAMMETKGD